MNVFSRISNYVTLKYKKVKYGNNFKVVGKIFVHGSKGKLSFGDNCCILSDETVNPTSGIAHTHFNVINNGRIDIGSNVGMSHVNIVSWNSITIEDNVLIGSGVKIWDSDFHSLDYHQRLNRPDINVKTAPILVSEGAFIGACSIILKGVTIGKHSIVGAGSVVTKDIPDNQIWAGNPAKFIKGIGPEEIL